MSTDQCFDQIYTLYNVLAQKLLFPSSGIIFTTFKVGHFIRSGRTYNVFTLASLLLAFVSNPRNLY